MLAHKETYTRVTPDQNAIIPLRPFGKRKQKIRIPLASRFRGISVG